MMQLLLSCLLAIAAPQEQESARAWQQVEPYRAPDFEGYFPDDAQGARRLDELISANTLRSLGDEEFLLTVRQGLRRTENYRTSILSWVGNRFIWGKEPQDADAIELCYHASDFSDEASQYGARHYAVYFGLSVVDEKSPSILRTLAELCVAVDDPNDIGRVAWGAASQLEALLPYLAPSLASEDEWEREKAQAVERIFKGEQKAFEWAAERALKPARPRPWKEMPEVRRGLREGSSAERLAILARLQAEGQGELMNDSYLADLAVAATDVEPDVREAIAVFVGGRWLWGAGLHLIAAEATDLMLQLSRDPVSDVREQAVYYGLSTYRGPREDVLTRLVELALSTADAGSHDRIYWALKNHGDSARSLLDQGLRGEDLQRARKLYSLYRKVFGERPTFAPEGVAGPRDLLGGWALEIEAPEARNQRLGSIRIVENEDGALSFELPEPESLGSELLDDLAWTEVGSTLHFNFTSTLEGIVLRTTGKLHGDRITGTTRVDGSSKLYVWSAQRERE